MVREHGIYQDLSSMQRVPEDGWERPMGIVLRCERSGYFVVSRAASGLSAFFTRK
jgi:hypothetical protein